MKNKDSIWQRAIELDRARSEFLVEAMREYDITYYAKLHELHEECGKSEDGHQWSFVDVTMLGNPIYRCNQCTLREVRQS